MFQLLKQYRKGFPAIDIFTPAIQEIQLTVCHHQLICHQPEIKNETAKEDVDGTNSSNIHESTTKIKDNVSSKANNQHSVNDDNDYDNKTPEQLSKFMKNTEIDSKWLWKNQTNYLNHSRIISLPYLIIIVVIKFTCRF